jgi:hypothetical protein
MVRWTIVEICVDVEANVVRQVHRTGSRTRRGLIRMRMYDNRSWFK